MIHHLRTGFVEFLLGSLNHLQITDGVKLVRNLIVRNELVRMTKRIRHFYRVNQEIICALCEHTHPVGHKIVIFPDSDTINVTIHFSFLLWTQPVRRNNSISLGAAACPIVVTLIVSNILDRTNNTLSNPTRIFHTRRLRVHKHIERADTFQSWTIFSNNSFCGRKACGNFFVGRQLCRHLRVRHCIRIGLSNHFLHLSRLFRVAQFSRNFFKLVTNLHPSMTNSQEIFRSTAKRRTKVIVTPPIIDDSLGDNGTVLIFNLVCHHLNARMVYRNRRKNNVDSRKRNVDRNAILVL